MKIFNIKDMKGGWFIGDFEPNVFKTSKFEAGYKFHPKGDKWDSHYHKLGTEISLILKGEMIINNILLKEGDILVIYPEEIVIPEFPTDCELFIIKTPSIPGDKYVVE